MSNATDERPISEITIGRRHRRDVGDVSSLAATIAALGLLHPIPITPDGRLIAGERRLRACQRLGWTTIPVHVVNLADIVAGELAENVERMPFLPSEIEAIRRELEPVERAAAESRMTLGKVSPGSGRARDKVAAFAGISGRTMNKISTVVAAAEAEPEKFGKLVADMDRSGRVDGAHRRLVNMRQAEVIRAEPPPLPSGPYRVASCDVPWPSEPDDPDPAERGYWPFPTMSIEQICALDVSKIFHADAVLWFWTTNFHMRHAYKILDAWGFDRTPTILTWAKDRPGRGQRLLGQTEHAIMAVRGNPVITLTNQSTLLTAPVCRPLATKPPEFYALVESLCPAPRYLELFARQARPGWDSWGDQAEPAMPSGSAIGSDSVPVESPDAGELFRYVRHHDVERFEREGWERLGALDQTHHGEWSALMRRIES